MAEKITSTECLDVYRITDGVLFKVYKCNFISYMYSDFNKRQHEKIAENVYRTKKQIVLRGFACESIIPEGSYIVEDNWVEPTSDYTKFRFELKTTGDCFAGDINKINKYFSAIDKITKTYL